MVYVFLKKMVIDIYITTNQNPLKYKHVKIFYSFYNFLNFLNFIFKALLFIKKIGWFLKKTSFYILCVIVVKKYTLVKVFIKIILFKFCIGVGLLLSKQIHQTNFR